MNNCIMITPLHKPYACEADVIEAWNSNADFRTPRERTAYMRKSDLKYANPLDGVQYIQDNMVVTLKHPMI